MNIGNYIDEVNRLNQLIDNGIESLRQSAREAAQAEHDYRKAKAIAWTQAPQGTVPVREAWVESETATERLSLDLAEGMKQASLEAVRSRRQQLSAVQSLLAAHKEEAAFGRTAP
jgi:hypothetical protein